MPISGRSRSYGKDENNRNAPEMSSLSSTSAPSNVPSLSSAFRSRSKTSATLTTSSRNASQTDLSPRELQLAKEPCVKGQPIEAYLYKDAAECPICFLYYPPYLNRTRCCDQAICSECFVQIKRPDPHPPDHHDEPSNPSLSNDLASLEEAETLVSEPAACPFCVQPEFGVTYDPPPFRRGLAYANQGPARDSSAVSSNSSVPSQGTGRKRGQSLSANAPSVITTDRVRPDWAKKLEDARSHQARRSAAATALHAAAFLMNGESSRGFSLGRRRRTGGDSGNGSGPGTPRLPEGLDISAISAILAQRRASRDSTEDLAPGRGSSRRHRVEDLEEIMLMEAIRLSIAAEEERKRKEEKEAAKAAKKESKQQAKEEKKQDKEQKKAEKQQQKAAKKTGLYPASANHSTASHSSAAGPSTSHDSAVEGKGKGIDRAGQPPVSAMLGVNPLSDPSSTLNRDRGEGLRVDSQRHLEQSRAQLFPRDSTQSPGIEDPGQPSRLRQTSNASSSASSFIDSRAGSTQNAFGASTSSFDQSSDVGGSSPRALHDGSAATTPGAAHIEPMFNFRSLAAMIDGDENNDPQNPSHVEHAQENESFGQSRLRGGSGGSSSSGKAPPHYETDNATTPVVRLTPGHTFDQKNFGDVRMLEQDGARQATH